MAEGALGPSDPANPERRSRLRRLDDLLDALETLNLADANTISAEVAARLVELGIRPPTGRAPFTEVIESVLAAQEPYMTSVPVERRAKPRRVPRDAASFYLRPR